MKQATSDILMVRPAHFGFNSQTAASNTFQHFSNEAENLITSKAKNEFDDAVEKLRAHGIIVRLVEDTPLPPKPDAVFPNNWITVSHSGEVYIFPMLSQNRLAEIREDIIERLRKDYFINQVIDIRKTAATRFLEGTGSMVFDHENKIAYACLSPRTNQSLFEAYCQSIQYKPISFIAKDNQGIPIYHTNVMMSIASGYAIICLESISNPNERNKLRNLLVETGHQIIEINAAQVEQFAGNMLALINIKGERLQVMSDRAYQALDEGQVSAISTHARILTLKIPIIEEIGGGSVRCMIAEIFCPPL